MVKLRWGYHLNNPATPKQIIEKIKLKCSFQSIFQVQSVSIILSVTNFDFQVLLSIVILSPKTIQTGCNIIVIVSSFVIFLLLVCSVLD